MPIKDGYDLQERQYRHKKQYPGIRLWDRSKRRSELGFAFNNIYKVSVIIISLLLLARISNAKINNSKFIIKDDTNGCESDNERALYSAIRRDQVDLVRILMRCNVSKVSFDGKDWGILEPYTYLGVAARYGNEKVAKFLLHHGANVDDEIYRTIDNQDTSQQKTALEEALVYSGSEHAPNPSLLSALLIKGANVSKVNSKVLSSFTYHAAHSTARIVDELELLLLAGLSPDAACDSKGTPLLAKFVNCYLGESIDGVEFARKLIDYGANVFYVDGDGKNYLHKSKSGVLTQLLIDAGLDVNALDQEGKSPLDTCNYSFMHTKAERLVIAGANITQLTLHQEVVISSPFLMQTLVNANLADFSLLDGKGRTPLHIIAFGRFDNHYTVIPSLLDTLEYVLRHTTDVNINSINPVDGSTPLHEAFIWNCLGPSQYTYRPDLVIDEHPQTQVIDMLIDHGAYPQKDFRDRTPLMRLSFSYDNANYAKEIINRYARFEAEYYGIDPEVYKQELLTTLLDDAWMHARMRDFVVLGADPETVAQFWHNVDQSQNLSMSCRGFVS